MFVIQRLLSPRTALAGMASDPTRLVPELRGTQAGTTASTRAADPHHSAEKEVAFRRLFDAHWGRVRHHVECFVDDPDEVDEISAEVFVVAWRKLDPNRPFGTTWLLRTANNKLRDRLRRARSRERAMEALSRGLETPAESLDPIEVLALRAAIRSLSAREQQVIILTYWDGLTAGEISEVLRTSQPAVWTTLTRARTKLRRYLESRDA